MFYGGGAFFYGFTTFFNPIRSEFGWTYAATAFAFSLQRLQGGIAAPAVGYLFDRFGPRYILLIGGVAGGMGLVLMSMIDSLMGFYGSFLVVSIGMSGLMGVGMPTVANWFIRKRGRALGLMMAGVGFSGTMAPVLVWLIDANGWRFAMWTLAIGFWTITIPVALVIRHRPEMSGLLPDGDLVAIAQTESGQLGEGSFPEVSQSSHHQEVDYTWREALGTRAFWLLSLAFLIQQAATSAVFVHEMPYLESLEISRGLAANVVMFMTLLSMVGRLGFGTLADTYEPRYVLAAAFALQAVGVFIFAYVTAEAAWLLIPFLLIYSPGYGGPIPVRPAIQGRYFGRINFGTILGLMSAATVIGGIVSPPLAGWIFDTFGSYRWAFIIFGGFTLLAIPAILMAKAPTPKTTEPVAVV
jgi:MFS family permease